MTLFKAKDAIDDVKERQAAKPKRLNPFQRMAADNHALREENAHLRVKVNAHDSRITVLEGFQSSQEAFNAGTQQRVGSLQRQAATANVPCHGCGQPLGDGAHGVWCFQVVDGG